MSSGYYMDGTVARAQIFRGSEVKWGLTVQRVFLEYQALIALKKSAALEGFPDGLVVKNPRASAGEAGLIPGLKDPVEEGVATHSIFLPGKSHGQKGLEGYSPWGHKE